MTQKLRTAARARMVEYLGSGRDPLGVAVNIAFDETQDVALRLQAASVALPFLHPKLGAQTIQATTLHAQVDQSTLLANMQDRLRRLTAAAAPMIDAEPPAAPALAETGR